MAKRLLVTGGGGFVGGWVVALAGGDWALHATRRTPAPNGRADAVWHTLDLSDAERLADTLRAVRPTAVVHAAAMADIDRCEQQPELAERVNVGVTAEIARYCADSGARLVLLSTDTVFDGRRGMYREDDPPQPVNVYGGTKVRAEQAVATTLPGAAIVRLSLVMGLPILERGNSFLARMLDAWREGKPVRVPSDEVRTPVDVVTLARAILELASGGTAGIVHVAGNDRLPRDEMARRIARRLGVDESLVLPTSGATPGRAPRPRDVSLDNARARRILQTPMLGLEEGLDLALSTRRGEER